MTWLLDSLVILWWRLTYHSSGYGAFLWAENFVGIGKLKGTTPVLDDFDVRLLEIAWSKMTERERRIYKRLRGRIWIWRDGRAEVITK